jgi:hypothetical protein
MSKRDLIISPKTKVGELLEAFPELESVLLELSPAFAKLKNPLLRKTVARVASLQQAAVVGGLKVDELVNRLRKEVGQNITVEVSEESQYTASAPPDWFDESKITSRLDATPIINSGESPMNEILKVTNNLPANEIFELKTPFVPAPIIDILKNKGFRVFSIQSDQGILTYFSR